MSSVATAQVQNSGSVAVSSSQSFPLFFQYRVAGNSTTQRVDIPNHTGGLAVGAVSGDKVGTIPNLRIGTNQVRFVVNRPTTAGVAEINTANNISPFVSVQVDRINPELSVGAFNSSGCSTVADFNNNNLCAVATLSMVVANSGGHVISGERVPYRFDYQPSGQAWIDGVDSGVDTGGILYNQTSAVLQGQVTNIPIGRHSIRACANNPVSGDFTEDDSSDASNCRTVAFTTAPPTPEMSLTSDNQLVRRDETVDLTWNVRAPYDMTCEILGKVADSAATFTHVGPTSQNTVTSEPLTSKFEFTLRCTPEPIADFPAFSSEVFTTTAIVDVVPSVEEI